MTEHIESRIPDKKNYMTDRYLDDQQCIDRLLNEWEKHGSLIVALDYDNTVFDFHEKGDAYDHVIALIRKVHKMGCKVVIFTCSNESRFPEIEKYLKDNDIPFDAINQNVVLTPYEARKIYYSIFLCDRAGLSASYRILSEVSEIVLMNRNGDKITNKQDI